MTEVADQLAFKIVKESDIAAPLAVTFAAMLEHLGPGFEGGNGPMPMVLEAWPGGRWFRDLGNKAGHLWGHVQVIKPPTLLEIVGPMFMSFAAASHVKYRLKENGAGTHLTVTHSVIADMPADMRAEMDKGWGQIVDSIAKRAMKK